MKARSILTVFCIVLISCFVFSCHKDQQQPASLTLSTSSITLDSTVGATDTFQVRSNVPWTLSVSPDSSARWLQVSPVQGQGNATVRLTVTSANPNMSQLLTITVKATGHAEITAPTVTVAQRSFLAVDSTSALLPGTSGSHNFKITTNSTWKVIASAPWLHVDASQGNGPGMLKVSADTNRSGASRTGYIYLYTDHNPNVPDASVQVTQSVYYGFTGFSPAGGVVGTTVTLKGVFPINPDVYFFNTKATIISHDSGTIVCTVPSNAIGGFIRVVDGYSQYTSYFYSTTAFVLHGGWNSNNNYPSGLPAGTSQYGLVFSWKGSLYSGFGSFTSGPPGPIYRFDTSTYKWTSAITIPANVVSLTLPIHYILNDKLYVGGMDLHDSASAFWEYDLTRGNDPTAWRKLATPPDLFNLAFAFTQGGNGYVMTGHATGSGGINRFYRFSTTGAADPGTWTLLTTLGVTNSTPSGFTIGNTTYFGGGGLLDASQIRNFWSMTLPSTTMTPIAPFPEDLNANEFAMPTWTIGNTGYVFNLTSGNMYTYDPNANTWTALKGMSGAMFAGAAGNRIFSWDLNSNTTFEYIP